MPLNVSQMFAGSSCVAGAWASPSAYKSAGGGTKNASAEPVMTTTRMSWSARSSSSVAASCACMTPAAPSATGRSRALARPAAAEVAAADVQRERHVVEAGHHRVVGVDRAVERLSRIDAPLVQLLERARVDEDRVPRGVAVDVATAGIDDLGDHLALD